MSSLAIALIVWAVVFSGALAGRFLRGVLPAGHLDKESEATLKLVTGMVATLSALVLGLLISSAKGTFERISSELTHMAADTIQLDRVLAEYGPEAAPVRELIKTQFAAGLEMLLSGDEAKLVILASPANLTNLERISGTIHALSPQNDTQRALQSRAQEIYNDVSTARWRVIVSRNSSISAPMLVVLVFWLTVIFAGFGMFAPRNPTVAMSLFVCALCVSAALFLALEMDRPLTGIVRVSGGPLQSALAHLGR